MNLHRLGLRLILGRRQPIVSGRLNLRGIGGSVTIARDRWGIPHIEAAGDDDAWFGLGFCQGQDRTFQLESLLRVCRGTLSEIAGAQGIAIDRLSRRIGFRHSSDLQIPVLADASRRSLEAFARGVTAGGTLGRRRLGHEFVLTRCRPSAWSGADVLAIMKLQSFLLGSSWDLELARLRILREDGPDALDALDPGYPAWLPTTAEPSGEAGPALDRLRSDVALLARHVSLVPASNSWVLDATRTQTGRPILANDPHLGPSLPPHWYLCHIRTPEWSAAGAAFAGGPGIIAGHNGFAAWGITAGCIDNADLFIEQVGPDGRSVRESDGFRPCPVRRERIVVKGQGAVTEEVLETPRGPIVSPALSGEERALSVRAVWLDPLPVEGVLTVQRSHGFDDFRHRYAAWPGPSLNLTYADETGAIGWQLVGQAPRRRAGYGTVPLPGWDAEVGWEPELVPFAEMPFRSGSGEGFHATANARPVRAGEAPFLGEDWIDGYRLARIAEALATRTDWDVTSSQVLQMDTESLPWREMKERVVAAGPAIPSAKKALDLLGDWDGRVQAGSAAAAVFELFAVEMARRLVLASAPRSHEYALARGFTPLQQQSGFAFRRTGQLVRLLREQPQGWLKRPWSEEIADVLADVVERLSARFGDDPSAWKWGAVRPLTLRHPLSAKKPLERIFNLGPFPWSGDTNTIAQSSVDPLDPFGHPGAIASLRMVIDVGDWERSRFALPGGQSGNPLSPHYADQLLLWRSGRGVPIAWSEAEVGRVTRHVLRLEPG